MTVVVPGFKTFTEDNITLTAGLTVRSDASLQIGNIVDTVEVKAQAIQMQTEDAKIFTAVQNRLVDELPLAVGGALRSPFDLVTTVPEAKGSGNALSLGGGQAASWSATLDGLSVNTNRSADATAPTGTALNLNSTSFGQVTAQATPPRQMQLALKLYW